MSARFPSYDDYVRLQISKVGRTGQARRGGIAWEYEVQKTVKPDLVRTISKFVAPSVTRHIVVLGARWGADVRFLREGGYTCPIEAIDLHDPPLTEWVAVGDAHDFVPARPPDLVWAYHVFEHLLHPSKALRHWRSNIVDRGIVFVALPDFGVHDPYDAQDEFSDDVSWRALCGAASWRVDCAWSACSKGKKRPAHYYILRAED